MSFKNPMILSAGVATLAFSLAGPAFAGANEALAACKSQIARDALLTEYTRVDSRMDEMRRRGRYTEFSIDVMARNEDGSSDEWTARCKARMSGKVEELDIARVGGEDSRHVAQAGS